jgi:hypothetical protein
MTHIGSHFSFSTHGIAQGIMVHIPCYFVHLSDYEHQGFHICESVLLVEFFLLSWLENARYVAVPTDACVSSSKKKN